ncbi:MAG TPA: hypothetical protein VGC79_24905, partial [Polyangiaceae bacterium]
HGDVITAWVASPKQTTGLDHLAVRALSEAYYAELVPCVTNVTDRIRSYGFYAWVVWSFTERYPEADYEEVVERFRCAEILLALIGARHEQQLDEAPATHGEGLPGRLVLLKALGTLKGAGRPLSLRRYAIQEDGNPDRYFKARLGGLGQYYLGTLQQLDVVGHASGSGDQFAVSPGRGVELAKVYAANVPGDRFWEAVAADGVRLETLDDLSAFCPCHLPRNAGEREKLLDIVLNRDARDGQTVPEMREAVALLLQAAEFRHEPEERREAVDDFRWSAFAGTLGGTAWSHPAVSSWRAYQQHDIIGLAVQSLFSTVYDLFELGGRPTLFTTREVTEWAIAEVRDDFTPGFLEQSFAEHLAAVRTDLPTVDDLDAELHERRLCSELLSHEEYHIAERLETISRLIASLLQRLPEGELYPGLSQPPEYFDRYPINLKSLRELAAQVWNGMSVGEWLRWLIANWAVGEQHRVALRKLRQAGEDTFRLRPTEQGLVPIGNIEVSFSNPRLGEALRALQDLALLDKGLCITDLGRALKGELGV